MLGAIRLGVILLGAIAGLCAISALGQTTQGILGGQVVDKLSGTPISGATVTCSLPGATQEQKTDDRGYYIFPLLSPGVYEITAEFTGYQSQLIAEQELPVAGRLEVNFTLRPLSDIWSSEAGRFSYTRTGRLVHFYATDADKLLPAEVEPADAASTNLGSTLSYVIDSTVLDGLPLRGRDAYSLLVALPGVTADSAIGRGLGISVNGQRPSASNFLLDGMENNNYLVTGNLTTIPPEGLQEYRISTNNFSAEYGGTSGFVANAITKTGGPEWHGYGYVYLKNDVLDANGYRTSPQGTNQALSRVPLKQIEPGLGVSGPVVKSKLFLSLTAEYLRLRTYLDPVMYQLPTAGFVASAAGTAAGDLMKSLQAPVATGKNYSAPAILSPTSSLNQYLATPRADATLRKDLLRLFLRGSFSEINRPDYAWTPYKDFVSPLTQNDLAVASGLIYTRGATTNELRAGWSRDDIDLYRSHAEVPVLASYDTDRQPTMPTPTPFVHTALPGSPLPYGYRNHNTTWQLIDNLTWTKARHVPKIGGGLLWRRIDGDLSFYQSGEYIFKKLTDFKHSAIDYALLPLDLQHLRQVPDFNRTYGYFQFSAFAQDSFKVTPRLLLSYGVRYENYGAPVNTGAVKDLLLQLGPGSDFPARLSKASFAPAPTGDQRLYDSDNKNVAGRAGFAWNLGGVCDFVVRGGYGIFYDRPFDNLWQTLSDNNFVPGQYGPLGTPVTFPYLDSAAQAVAALTPTPFVGFPNLTLFQPGLRDGYVHSYFLGLERPLTGAFTLSANLAGSEGRKLIATDVINRNILLSAATSLIPVVLSLPPSSTNPPGRLPAIDYRSNQGDSNYNALTVTGRYRSSLVQAQVSYSWSHSIDNQSDALGANFFNLGYTSPLQVGTPGGLAMFTVEDNSRVDRGNADFDQRQNLVMYSLWSLPAWFASTRAAGLFRNWELGELAAFRSGFPYSVDLPYSGGLIPVNRANLNLADGSVYIDKNADGGRVLLNWSDFANPKTGVGDTTRNEFRGPGIYSVDFSLRRRFQAAEHLRVTLRADAFNILNHANLNNPDSMFSMTQMGAFGFAPYGRKGTTNGFPGSVPLDETPRQIQLSVRVDF